MNKQYDVIVIGAGAAGLFCAFNTANRGKRVLVLDHANKVGKKILMSGGGRCNFTNLDTSFENFSSSNPHFCKSALSQYTAYDFLSLVEKHEISYVEKEPGQLFCKNSSKDILHMLLSECAKAAVKIYKRCSIEKITLNNDKKFTIEASCGEYSSDSLVIATGGLSIPTLGATGFGYEVAKQFGHKIISTKASLVPFTLSKDQLDKLKNLAGVSLPASVSLKTKNKDVIINDNLLFTHRGLSGPVILKISSHWEKGDEIIINLLPGIDIENYLAEQQKEHAEQLVVNNLSHVIPKGVALFLCDGELKNKKIKQLNKADILKLIEKLNSWKIIPEDSEGYKTAEVTSGGISTELISSKTLESAIQKNLYFIGEVLDVTGDLGGYNFQWAWSSAWCASQNI